MSYYIPEASTVIYRLIVLASNKRSLKELFEKLIDQVSTELCAGKKIDLRSAPLKNGRARLCCFFTLGQQSNNHARVQLIGYDLESHPPGIDAWGLCDGVLAHIPQDTPEAENFLKIRNSEQNLGKSLVLSGFKELDDEQNNPTLRFRQNASRAWAEKYFANRLYLRNEDELLKRGLEWSLSH